MDVSVILVNYNGGHRPSGRTSETQLDLSISRTGDERSGDKVLHAMRDVHQHRSAVSRYHS